MRRFASRAAGTFGTALLAGSALVLAAAAPAGAVQAGAAPAAATWQVQKSPNETRPGGQIGAVSCSAADACTAVGDYLNSSGLNVTMAQAWNGTAWRRQAAASPPGAPAPQLDGVSCVSAAFCEAVGSTDGLSGSGNAAVAQAWNGSSWQLQPVPAPTGSTSTLLRSVSCVSASFCEAVGGYVTSGGAPAGLAETWNGTSWSVQSVPIPAGSAVDRLDGVSCTSPGFCVAVDFYSATAEMWNGTTWTARPVPFPAGMSSPGFDGVSCPSASFCEAVGYYNDPQSAPSLRLLADSWNGTSWREQSSPKLVGTIETTLSAVSCVSATFCETVGTREAFISGVDTFRSVAEVWRGSSWQVQRTTSGTGTDGTSLGGVSCPSASACEAGGGFPAWMEAWNGSSWQTQAIVRPGGATNNGLTGISCLSVRSCEAVGLGTGPGLAEGWDGTSWRIQHGTLPAALSGVSCTSASFCEAVGGTALVDVPAAAMWNGTTWQSQPTPGFVYAAVSCATADLCQAVGPSGAMVWDGTAWSAETLPYPSPLSGGASYTGVSCPSASACEVVGGRTASGAAFAAGWDGTSWTLQTVPSPQGAKAATLTRVSCVAADSCEAVGSASPGGAFAEVWNGSTWTPQPVPSPAGTSTALFGVSCTAANACTAVGAATQASPFAELTLAEVWDGTSWSVQSTASPSPAHNQLIGVSCGASGACTAVGWAYDPGNIQATLAESGG